ncbi:hypothetical protein [Arsenicicoccus piscis]|uniref:DUF222 domain-containing protein n=1 Tax=Arsenicicoccus piscis TaxID=673954 RepID=A0ABQ6HRD0_9MICO|nr:hypothetical protein [Arsenicicoccus piscis]GMA20916.1 hypothetical protein GCM10025862_29370 [Arsenicicoccus piscis]
MSEPHTHSLPEPLRALAGVPGSALATMTAAFTDEAAIGFDELTALTSSVLTLDQHGAPALTSHGEDAAMLLTLCQQTIAYLTLTQAMTVHALTAATAQARLAADHGPDHTPSATARGRAEGRARTAVLAEAVATCGWDPTHRALVHHLAAMSVDRTQIAARLLAQGVLTGPMVAMLLSRRTEHLTDPQVAWLTRHCANLTHPTQPDPDSQQQPDDTDSQTRGGTDAHDVPGGGNIGDGADGVGGGGLRLVGSTGRRERVAAARRQAFAEACDWTDADWVDPDVPLPSWAVFRDRFDQGLAWLLADDPDVAGDYQTGMAARCVTSRLDPEGTGSLTVTGDGVAVAAARNRVHRLARRLRQLGDERTIAQIAADLTLTLLTHGYITCPHCSHTITTTTSHTSDAGDAGDGGADAGPAGACGGIHDETTDGQTSHGPVSDGQVSVGDVMLPYPGLAAHRVPGVDQGLADAVAAGLAPPATVVHVTVSLETLLGMSQLPARMDAGPVRAWLPARQARTLALTLGGTWQRIVTDPVTGVALNTTIRSYQPGPATRAHLAMLDNGCRAPAAPPATTCSSTT